MEVVSSQCSCGHEYLKTFWCGICHRLALSPRIHDGGYGQKFCQQVYCNACVDSISFNPLAPVRYGKNGEKIYVCPSGVCNQNFVPPFFRFLTPLELGLYADISIECLKCHKIFNPYSYAEHSRRCNGVVASMPTNLVNNLAYTPQKALARKVEYLVEYEGKWRVRSCNFTSLAPEEASLSQMPDGHPIPIYGNYLNQRNVIVKKVSNRKLFLDGVAESLSLPSGSVDVVALFHRSLSQFGTFEDFAAGLPADAPLTIVDYRSSLSNPKKDASWLFLHGMSRRGCMDEAAGASGSEQ